MWMMSRKVFHGKDHSAFLRVSRLLSTLAPFWCPVRGRFSGLKGQPSETDEPITNKQTYVLLCAVTVRRYV